MKKVIAILTLTLIIVGCSDTKQTTAKNTVNEQLQVEIDSLKTIIANHKSNTNKQISTFLTFQENNAEEAMNFYVSLFKNSEVTNVQRHGKDGPAKEGSIMWATFKLNGSQFACSDSPIKHEWTFTPAVSIFIECESNEELEHLFEKLSENGMVMMPLDNYGFSQRFGFVADRFGVSWQLNLQ